MIAAIAALAVSMSAAAAEPPVGAQQRTSSDKPLAIPAANAPSAGSSPRSDEDDDKQRRRLRFDRTNLFSSGGGPSVLFGGYTTGERVADLGLSVLGRYRPFHNLALEANVAHYDSAWVRPGLRKQTHFGLAVQYHPWSRSRLSPYFSAGLNLAWRHRDVLHLDPDTYVRGHGLLFGSQIGGGLEAAIAPEFALDLGVRFMQYVNRPADPYTRGSAWTVGLTGIFYF